MKTIEAEYGFFRIVKIIWTGKRVIIFTVFLVTLIAVLISLVLPRYYKATSVILSPAESGVFSSLGFVNNLGVPGLTGGGENQNRYLSILKSRTLLEQVAKHFNLQNHYNCTSFEETIEKLKSNIRIVVGEEMQISVSVYDRDQDLVAPIANYIVHCLDSLNIKLTSKKAKENRIFIVTISTRTLGISSRSSRGWRNTPSNGSKRNKGRNGIKGF